MKFFAKQKVDAVGITSVTLQKILLFLMILSIFTVFNGGLFSFFLCLVGFLGAYRRHTGMLSAYVVISVLIIVLCFFVALGGMFMMSSDGYQYDNYYYYTSSSAEIIASGSNSDVVGSSSSSSSNSDLISPERPPMHKLQRLFSSLVSASGSQSASSQSSESADSESTSGNFIPYSSDSYYEDEDLTGIIFLSVVVMVIGFFLAYLKVYSLVLAWRLRKMILTEKLTPLPTKDSQVHEFAPANTSCAVELEAPAAPVAPFQHAPMFAPGFAPYPYAMPMGMMAPPQQGQQFQYPHHMMFGQQPVFYTYAPQTEQPTEKL